MQKYISQKQLYSNIKSVSDEVQKGTTFIVLKYSQPVYQISPLQNSQKKTKKKYMMHDIDKFIFESKKRDTVGDEFSAVQFDTGEENLSENIDNILYNK